MNNNQFKMHFRLSSTAFEDLLNKLHTCSNEENSSARGYPKMELEKGALIMLWCLGNIESFWYVIVANAQQICINNCILDLWPISLALQNQPAGQYYIEPVNCFYKLMLFTKLLHGSQRNVLN
ncbi:hypothetical protein ILUMI_10758 [Ignelater luminosus]|uniref:Uncharacterized protein n=1 Tax=Ignelater luminosus TaxID=2038154 RepID=A0A8K0D1I6_IGNLU|nr:hypothetical protein ILUMI_10758 [Ignelater luminosus]